MLSSYGSPHIFGFIGLVSWKVLVFCKLALFFFFICYFFLKISRFGACLKPLLKSLLQDSFCFTLLLLFGLWDTCNLSSLSRERIWVPCTERWDLAHWTPGRPLLYLLRGLCLFVGKWLMLSTDLVTRPWWLRWWWIRLQFGRPGFDPWVRKSPWRSAWQPSPVFLPGEPYGQRSLAGYSPWGCRVEHDWASGHAHMCESMSTFDVMGSFFPHYPQYALKLVSQRAGHDWMRTSTSKAFLDFDSPKR